MLREAVIGQYGENTRMSVQYLEAAEMEKAVREHERIFRDANKPKFMYHPVKPPIQVFSQREIEELGPEWSEVYIYQEYPKVKYHWSKSPVTVANADEENALGLGWAGSPAAFDRYRGPRPARTEEQNPTKWVDEWLVPDLQSDHRKKIKAQLLRADGAFERSPDPDSAAVASMRQGFDGIARVLSDAGILTEGSFGRANTAPGVGLRYRRRMVALRVRLARGYFPGADWTLLGLAGGHQGLEKLIQSRNYGMASQTAGKFQSIAKARRPGGRVGYRDRSARSTRHRINRDTSCANCE
jgi:hypothetical protein